MNKIKNGDIVGRVSYNKDIFFIVRNAKNKQKIILEGLFKRILADSNINDLELVDINEIREQKKIHEDKIFMNENRIIAENLPGTILHLDGDKRYSQKSLNYYNKMGMTAIVKNIPEYKQPIYIYKLLDLYRPDILVITGHDGMIQKNSRFYDLYNYKNSKYFIKSIKEARKYERERNNNIVIFAGACQSFYEALINAGANFASSPARILIDIMDPLIVARAVATTDEFQYIRIEDIENELRDGRKGVGGIGAKRKKPPCNKSVTKM